MTRRALLLGVLAAPLLPRPGSATPAGSRHLRLRHMATGAAFAGPFHDGRRHDAAALAELSLVLADTRTGASRPFDPAALDVLWEVAQRCGQGGAELLILSGYRTPETNAFVHGAGDSQHLRAGALDVQLGQAQLTAFADAALALGRGGVGLYARRGFVHVDSGPVRHWGDASAGRAVPPREDRLSRMAEAWAATRGR